jgi:tetratricopeptide (TPR) repeat protein
MDQPGAETLDKVRSFFDRFGRGILIATGAVVAIGAVSFFTLRARAASEQEAAGRLAEASVYYWQGDYARASQMAKQIYDQYGSTPSGADAHRLAGDAYFWAGDFKTAITEYRAYLDKQKTGLLSDAARRSLAYALESDRQFTEAAKTYDELVGRFDRTSSAEFLNASARCHRELQQPAEAVKRLQRLVDEFGETAYANAALVELAEMKAVQATATR